MFISLKPILACVLAIIFVTVCCLGAPLEDTKIIDKKQIIAPIYFERDRDPYFRDRFRDRDPYFRDRFRDRDPYYRDRFRDRYGDRYGVLPIPIYVRV
jgi:hypothetical protein